MTKTWPDKFVGDVVAVAACSALSCALMLSACSTYRELGATAPASWGAPVDSVESSSECPAIAGAFQDVMEGSPNNAGASDYIGDPRQPVDKAGLVGPMRLSYLLLHKIVDPWPKGANLTDEASLTLDAGGFAISVRRAGKVLEEGRFSHSARQFSCARGQLRLQTHA